MFYVHRIQESRWAHTNIFLTTTFHCTSIQHPVIQLVTIFCWHDRTLEVPAQFGGGVLLDSSISDGRIGDMAIMKEALQHGAIEGVEYTFGVGLGHIDNNAVRVRVRRNAVLVEVLGEFVINRIEGAVKIKSADPTVLQDLLSVSIIYRAEVTYPIKPELSPLFAAGEVRFGVDGPVIVWLIGDIF